MPVAFAANQDPKANGAMFSFFLTIPQALINDYGSHYDLGEIQYFRADYGNLWGGDE